MIRTLGLATVTLALAGVAHAEALAPYPPVTKGPLMSLASPTAAKAIDPVGPTFSGAPTPLPRGVARTSVEHSGKGITGSAGLLCGLQPSADDSGIGTARGYNTEGRFIGAKLGFSF